MWKISIWLPDYEAITYHSDSRVVLGYITNKTRCFYVYVSNRVERIRRALTPEQWYYIPTQQNPADLATWSVNAQSLNENIWLRGPSFFHQCDDSLSQPAGWEVEQLAEADPEVHPFIQVLATQVPLNTALGTCRFSRFSKWITLIKAVAKLILFVQKSQKSRTSESPEMTPSVHTLLRAKYLVIQNVQHECYKEEISFLKGSTKLPKTSPLLKLSPVIDNYGLLRVGGRLERSGLSYKESHPLILLSSHHVAMLLVRYYHERVQHQGRHFTLSLIRSSGLWIVGGKQLVNRIINSCIKCKKLRGRQQIQKMAHLPKACLTPAPPFSYVGLDVFGPWLVITRQTRGGVANNKRWAVLFTCLATTAIHIAVIESMDTSSFINALCRFLALRGPAIQLPSERSTNFTGAYNELQSCFEAINNPTVQSFLSSEGCEWIFNSPHASHTGGAWERMIGVARRILDSILADISPTHLTHEVLSMLTAEVAAIVNARPLVPASTY